MTKTVAVTCFRLLSTQPSSGPTNLAVDSDGEKCQKEEDRPDGGAGQHTQRFRIGHER